MDSMMTSIGHRETNQEAAPKDLRQEPDSSTLLSFHLTGLGPRFSFREQEGDLQTVVRRQRDDPSRLIAVQGRRRDALQPQQKLGQSDQGQEKQALPSEEPLDLGIFTRDCPGGRQGGRNAARKSAKAGSHSKKCCSVSNAAGESSEGAIAKIPSQSLPDLQESSGQPWQWVVEHSAESPRVSSTEIWDFRTHLETPSPHLQSNQKRNPWLSPDASRQQRKGVSAVAF